MAWIVCALRLESRMTPKRIGVKGGTVVCSSASSKYHGLDKLLFYFPVYVSTAACIALVFMCYSTVLSSLTSSWRPAHVSWLESFGKFSLLEAFLILSSCGPCIFLHPDILGPNYQVQNRTPTLLGTWRSHFR